MKKIIHVALIGALIATAIPTHCVGLLGGAASLYNGTKNRLRSFHASLVLDGMMRRAHQKMPEFLKGESKLDSCARIMLISSAFYLGIKPMLKNDNNVSKIFLGTLGWIFTMLGVDNVTVQGANYAEIAKEKQKELAGDIRNAVKEFAGENATA